VEAAKARQNAPPGGLGGPLRHVRRRSIAAGRTAGRAGNPTTAGRAGNPTTAGGAGNPIFVDNGAIRLVDSRRNVRLIDVTRRLMNNR
jgi:hypothetical protein